MKVFICFSYFYLYYKIKVLTNAFCHYANTSNRVERAERNWNKC